MPALTRATGIAAAALVAVVGAGGHHVPELEYRRPIRVAEDVGAADAHIPFADADARIDPQGGG